MPHHGEAILAPPEVQPVISWAQPAPVINTWYPFTGILRNARLLRSTIQVLVAGESLQARLVIDGETWDSNILGVAAGAWSYVSFDIIPPDHLLIGPTSLEMGHFTFLDGRSCQLFMRKTTANGAGDLEANLVYGVHVEPGMAPPEMQPVLNFVQPAPVINIWYTVLDTERDPRLLKAVFRVLTTGESIQVRLIIDGQIWDSQAVAAVAGTWYYVMYSSSMPDYLYLTATTAMWAGYTFLEGRSVQVQMRKTTANGAGDLEATLMRGLYR